MILINQYVKLQISFYLLFLFATQYSYSKSTISSSSTADSFSQKIEEILNKTATSNLDYSIDVYSLDDHTYLYRKNQDSALNPASNIKIITTATAISLLRPSFRFKTEFFTDGTITNGTLNGNLYIKGTGDPTITTDKLYIISVQLHQLGIQTVTGNLLYDDTHLQPLSQLSKDFGENSTSNPPLSALTLNSNIITFHVIPKSKKSVEIFTTPPTDYVSIKNKIKLTSKRSTKVTYLRRYQNSQKEVFEFKGNFNKKRTHLVYRLPVKNPPLYVAMTLQSMLRNQGTKILGTISPIKENLNYSNLRLIFTHYSESLANALALINKYSINITAELLLASMGAVYFDPPGTQVKGISVINEYLNALGVSEQYIIENGSGLSRNNRVSAATIVRVLINMYRDFETFPEFISSFGISGTDGTVRKRFKNIQGRIRAKTGYIREASCLSGYAQSSDGKTIAFSILINSRRVPHSKRVKLIDKIAAVLTKDTNLRLDLDQEFGEPPSIKQVR